jgi:hypothetical protein
MADNYRLYGTKNQGERVGSVKLSRNRVMVLRGEPVELSEKEVDDLRARGYDIRKLSSSSQPDEPSEQSTENPES